MPFDNIISRTDAAGLIPEEVSTDLLKYAAAESAALSYFRRVPVGRAQVRMPIWSALPTAYWVNGDTGQKQTTEVNWTNKYLNIEEIAAIVPIPDNVLADADIDIWTEIMPAMTEAVGRTLDAAIFFGTNAPASFPDDVFTSLDAAANDVTEGTAAASGGYMDDVDRALAALEADGYEADLILAATTFRGKLRSARDSTGQRLDAGRISGDLKSLDGIDIVYPMRGLWPTAGSSASPRAIFLQRDQFILGIRSDISYKIFTEGVIQDDSGTIVYNLMQQDMSAMRLTFRVGWQVANLINRDQPTEGSRYPAASLDIP
jgi:HK97 family phage major capsid protein